jgi:hypothetical protein
VLVGVGRTVSPSVPHYVSVFIALRPGTPTHALVRPSPRSLPATAAFSLLEAAILTFPHKRVACGADARCVRNLRFSRADGGHYSMKACPRVTVGPLFLPIRLRKKRTSDIGSRLPINYRHAEYWQRRDKNRKNICLFCDPFCQNDQLLITSKVPFQIWLSIDTLTHWFLIHRFRILTIINDDSDARHYF